MERIYDGTPVRLVNEMYKTQMEGTAVVPEIFPEEMNHVPAGAYGVWTIRLVDGNRYRSEGKLESMVV